MSLPCPYAIQKHNRFLIIDDSVYLLGASVKDIGNGLRTQGVCPAVFQKMKKRDPEIPKGWGQIVTPPFRPKTKTQRSPFCVPLKYLRFFDIPSEV